MTPRVQTKRPSHSTTPSLGPPAQRRRNNRASLLFNVPLDRRFSERLRLPSKHALKIFSAAVRQTPFTAKRMFDKFFRICRKWNITIRHDVPCDVYDSKNKISDVISDFLFLLTRAVSELAWIKNPDAIKNYIFSFSSSFSSFLFLSSLFALLPSLFFLPSSFLFLFLFFFFSLFSLLSYFLLFSLFCVLSRSSSFFFIFFIFFSFFLFTFS